MYQVHQRVGWRGVLKKVQYRVCIIVICVGNSSKHLEVSANMWLLEKWVVMTQLTPNLPRESIEYGTRYWVVFVSVHLHWTIIRDCWNNYWVLYRAHIPLVHFASALHIHGCKHGWSENYNVCVHLMISTKQLVHMSKNTMCMVCSYTVGMVNGYGHMMANKTNTV